MPFSAENWVKWVEIDEGGLMDRECVEGVGGASGLRKWLRVEYEH